MRPAAACSSLGVMHSALLRMAASAACVSNVLMRPVTPAVADTMVLTIARLSAMLEGSRSGNCRSKPAKNGSGKNLGCYGRS